MCCTNRSNLIAVFTGDANDVPESALPGPVAVAATAEALALTVIELVFLENYRIFLEIAGFWLNLNCAHFSC